MWPVKVCPETCIFAMVVATWAQCEAFGVVRSRPAKQATKQAGLSHNRLANCPS